MIAQKMGAGYGPGIIKIKKKHEILVALAIRRIHGKKKKRKHISRSYCVYL